MELKKDLKTLSISSITVGVIAMLFNSWLFSIAAIILAFFLYRRQEGNTDSKKHFIIAIITAILGCIGIVGFVLDKIEQSKKEETKAKNEALISDMKSFVSELSPITIDDVKINGDFSKYFKVKSIRIEPKEIENENYLTDRELGEKELEENSFVQNWTAKLLFERSGIKLSSNSDTYYTGDMKFVFEDESGYPITATENDENLSEDDFYKALGETISYEYTFILGKGKEKDALSKIKSLKVESKLQKGSHYKDELQKRKDEWNDAIDKYNKTLNEVKDEYNKEYNKALNKVKDEIDEDLW